jgi:predicted HicB family RNase H-like nuclease
VRALAGLTAVSSGVFGLGICFKLALHINYSTSNANVMQKSTSKRNLNVRVSKREYKALELNAAKDDRSITEVMRAFLRSLPEYQQLSQEGIEQDDPE